MTFWLFSSIRTTTTFSASTSSSSSRSQETATPFKIFKSLCYQATGLMKKEFSSLKKKSKIWRVVDFLSSLEEAAPGTQLLLLLLLTAGCRQADAFHKLVLQVQGGGKPSEQSYCCCCRAAKLLNEAPDSFYFPIPSSFFYLPKSKSD